MKIGLLGYGTVGRSVAELLIKRSSDIEVKKILRRPGKACGPNMTESFNEILNDPEIDCVVEALSGRDPALLYIRTALQAGKHVVTSNKAALAADFAGLTALADEKGVSLLFEASCGGGMPWVEALKKASRFDEIEGLSGILNGTCNYILDRMERMGMSFDAALAEAQQLGYAEADPTADITGADIRNKAVISAATAYHADVTKDFPVAGIERITKPLLDGFLQKGLAVRLMMLSKRRDNLYAVGVVPVLVPADSAEHAVKDNFNCARLTGDVVGDLAFYGQGAGGMPTANAIIQDLISLRNGTAENVSLDKHMVYSPDVLRGTGHFPDGELPGRSLAELVDIAREKACFFAFEPEER